MGARGRTLTVHAISNADHRPRFTAEVFTTNLRAYGLRLSMETVRDC